MSDVAWVVSSSSTRVRLHPDEESVDDASYPPSVEMEQAWRFDPTAMEDFDPIEEPEEREVYVVHPSSYFEGEEDLPFSVEQEIEEDDEDDGMTSALLAVADDLDALILESARKQKKSASKPNKMPHPKPSKLTKPVLNKRPKLTKPIPSPDHIPPKPVRHKPKKPRPQPKKPDSSSPSKQQSPRRPRQPRVMKLSYGAPPPPKKQAPPKPLHSQSSPPKPHKIAPIPTPPPPSLSPPSPSRSQKSLSTTPPPSPSRRRTPTSPHRHHPHSTTPHRSPVQPPKTFIPPLSGKSFDARYTSLQPFQDE